MYSILAWAEAENNTSQSLGKWQSSFHVLAIPFEWWPSYFNTLEITDWDLRVADDTNWLLSDNFAILLRFLTIICLYNCWLYARLVEVRNVFMSYCRQQWMVSVSTTLRIFNLQRWSGTGLRRRPDRRPVVMDMPFCGRPRKPRPLRTFR